MKVSGLPKTNQTNQEKSTFVCCIKSYKTAPTSTLPLKSAKELHPTASELASSSTPQLSKSIEFLYFYITKKL